MLHGASSRVLAFGHVSEPFRIEQGCRQGSIISPFLYTVFIDELLSTLASSQHGLFICSLNVCAPTQADDIVLMSLSEEGLKALLSICKCYSDQWRYSYNASKCAILVHNRRRRSPGKTNFLYDGTSIKEVSDYRHLGITQHKSRKFPANCDVIRQTARSTLFSFSASGLCKDGLNPLTGAKLYTTTVLPRSFFGCELWYDISISDLKHLETTHHFCLKQIQNLPKLTRSDMVKGMLGFTSIEAYIDLQKLLFLGYLCRLRSTDLAYQVFILRLYQFNCSISNRSEGLCQRCDTDSSEIQLAELPCTIWEV